MSKRANKNTNNQAEDEDDGEIPQEYLRNTQDKGERLRIRTGYRTLIEDLNNKKHELVNPENNTLTEALEVANTLNKDVRTPREGALDSTAILTISSLARQQADNLNTDFVRFEPIEFAEKLVAFIQRENNAPSDSQSRISPDGWKNLGAAGQKLFSKNPPFHFMAGSFDRDVKERPQRNPNVKKITDKETIDKETIPKKMQSFDGSGGKNEATTAEVERVLDILQKLYKQTDENPICFFEFVLNPESFGQTIENIFYTSFLIKDGLAKTTLDEDNLPLIEPVENNEGERNKQQSKTRNHQTILSITPAEWKELIRVYQIEEPLIPTRDHTKPPAKKPLIESKTQNNTTPRVKGKK
ncbi:EP300-interacting inhibitor of differentiation 3-like [Mytilus galloprovincialis]|uniref:EP300-interacting inhibitor of differentiation 3-like n=1 Tax=Mytilus galloprovincialis TaxID=29158 RepID=UPI003F7C968E